MNNIIQLRDTLFRGGIEVLLLDVCKNGKANGLNFFVVTFNDGDLVNDFIENGIEVIKIKRNKPIDINVIKQLRKIIVEKNINVIHSHQALEGLYAYLATRGLNVKNIISHHGSVYPIKDKLVMKYLIKHVFANIAVSNSYLKRLKEEEGFNTKNNFHVVYNGIDSVKLETSEGNLKNELKLSQNSLLLGMIGNFNNSGRDQFTICKALPRIYEKYNNVSFVFVGGWNNEPTSSYKKCYDYCKEKGILNKTFFVGKRSDIGNILKSLDIFVYSSNHDTFGIAVVEAMFCGTPTVINDIPPMLEISKNGEFAKIYKSKDEIDLFNNLSVVLDSDELLQNLSYNAKNWATENFSIDQHLNKLKKLYTE